MHHSDRGVQYACWEFRQKLEDLGIERSKSGRGDCYDNAVMESFFKTLKAEAWCYHRKVCDTGRRRACEQASLEYIEVFYKPLRRRHSSFLGYMSPAEYEASLN